MDFLTLLEEAGFVDAEMVGETGFNSSPITKGVLFRAVKSEQVITKKEKTKEASREKMEVIKMLKVGIIRCQQTEDMCCGTTDFKVAQEGKLAFQETGPVEIVGFVSCGGCPGKRIFTRAKMMKERGAEAIVFASCMSKGNPIGFPCPHFGMIEEMVRKKIGSEIKIISWTH